MSTVIELEQAGALVKWASRSRLQPMRGLYMVPQVVPWLRDTLPTLGARLSGGRLKPLEQVYNLSQRFIDGRPLICPDDYHVMTPIDGGIWELRTPDVRFVGWFSDKDQYIISAVVEAFLVKEFNLYGALVREAIGRRDALDLDEPKYVDGDNIYDVVSAAN